MKKLDLNQAIVKRLYLEGNSAYTIAKIFKCSEGTIQKVIRKLGIMRNHSEACSKRTNKPTGIKDESFFESINTEEKAYWLGFFMADGCVNIKANRLQLGLAETEPLEKFKKAIKSNQEIKTYTRKDGHISYRFDITSKKMCNDLIKHGCIPNKTHILKFPDIKSELIHHLIRGYFDGDGCIYFRKPKGNYVSPVISIVGNINFLEGLRKNLKMDEYKMALKIRHPERNNNIRYFVLSGKKACKKFFKIVYNDATVYLKRKYLKFTTI